MEITKNYLSRVRPSQPFFRPEFYRTWDKNSAQKLDELLATDKEVIVYDEIYGQLKELIKSRHPAVKIKEEDYQGYIDRHLSNIDPDAYGVWVYYPWSKKLIHLLDEEEFIEIRTNRNRYKLTPEEQHSLRQRKIGVVGLSVGQSIAMTLAMERTCGELRLADFDTAELSNLNRIRTGVHNLGLKKTIIAAREIAEIDPFLPVKIFSDGLHADNIDSFFTEDGKLDLLVEVCDGLDIKIISRYKAKQLRIPVVMDTNDRGMLDVERFDLEPDRPIMHGFAEGLDPDNIRDLTNEEKIPYILKMVGIDTISTRLKASMMEVEQSINTWPQLASSVVLGGAITTDVCRRILLDEFHESGRYYIDLEDLVKDAAQEGSKTVRERNPFVPLETEEMARIAGRYVLNAGPVDYEPLEEHLEKMIDAALAAPSAGNNQPWKWHYEAGYLFLFHDRYRSWSWGDFEAMGAFMGLGTALENLHLQAAALSSEDKQTLFPLADEDRLVAVVEFQRAEKQDSVDLELASGLFSRYTNRKLGLRKPLPIEFYEQMEYIVSRKGGVVVLFDDKEQNMNELGDIIASCDRIRMLHEQGHEEFYSEVRWNREEAEAHKDGIELAAVDLKPSEIAGFSVARDRAAVSLLSEWGKGQGFKSISRKALQSASAVVLFVVPEFSKSALVKAGKAVEDAWIFANAKGVSVHPMLSPAFFFNRLRHGGTEGMKPEWKEELKELRNRFLSIFPLNEGQSEVFLMKLSIADDIGIRSLRKSKGEVFSKA